MLTPEERRQAVKGIKEGEGMQEKKESFFKRKVREYKETQKEFKEAKGEARKEYIEEQHEKRLEHARKLGKQVYYKPAYKEVAKGVYKLGKKGLGMGYKYAQKIGKQYTTPIKKGKKYRPRIKKGKKYRPKYRPRPPIDLMGFNSIYGAGFKRPKADMFGFPLNKGKTKKPYNPYNHYFGNLKF